MKLVIIVAILVATIGCTPESVIPENISKGPVPTATPTPVKSEVGWISWEKYPENRPWSVFTASVVDKHFATFDAAKDVTQLCPKYRSLNKQQKLTLWTEFFSAVARYESAWNPVTRMHETTMGTDPVTKKPVYSEGLLQLSYQDVKWARYCEFDWAKDKDLPVNSPKKTILDPYKNLSCGIQIMAAQIKRTGNTMLKSGVYWAVIKIDGKYTKIPQIISMTKKVPGCV